jgi:hypothetical protein
MKYTCVLVEELTVVAFAKPLIIILPELPVDWITNPLKRVLPVNATALVLDDAMYIGLTSLL